MYFQNFNIDFNNESQDNPGMQRNCETSNLVCSLTQNYSVKLLNFEQQ